MPTEGAPGQAGLWCGVGWTDWDWLGQRGEPRQGGQAEAPPVRGDCVWQATREQCGAGSQSSRGQRVDG